MIRNIVRDQFFLQQKARPAEADDLAAACDLADTLDAYRTRCAGMAANMIGERAAIICVLIGNVCTTFYNPEIIEQSEPYTAEEGCLCLDGTRKTQRYNRIRLRFQDVYMQTHEMTYRGFTAEVIQHEMDHLRGILI